jgi:hypothetical protein
VAGQGPPRLRSRTHQHRSSWVFALVTQLIRVAGVPAGGIIMYDVANGRTTGEPIFGRFKGDKASADLRGVNFVVNDDHGLLGRIPVILDEKTEIHFSGGKKTCRRRPTCHNRLPVRST